MRVQFIDRLAGPERLIAEAELIFDDGDGPLAGLKLVGFSLWRGSGEDIFVTFPSRAFGVGNERRFFDYLRPADADASGDARALIVRPFQAIHRGSVPRLQGRSGGAHGGRDAEAAGRPAPTPHVVGRVRSVARQRAVLAPRNAT